MAISTFGDTHSDPSPGRMLESTYEFLCRVSGDGWDQCRILIEEWLAHCPASARHDVVQRFQSRDDRQFTSAFWELYLHEMYRCDGWTVETHPDVTGVRTHPDFLVSKGGTSYYVEATCVFEGRNDNGASARLNTVDDAINKIFSPDFYLVRISERIGTKPLATKELRKSLEEWLAHLDPDEGDYSPSDPRPEHQFEWEYDDWHLAFRPMPRSPAFRGDTSSRRIGVSYDDSISHKDNGAEELSAALHKKGRKYGNLPLLIAVNQASGDKTDWNTWEALYGTCTEYVGTPGQGQTLGLIKPGYWGSLALPEHRHVAGLLMAEGVHIWRVAEYAPAFWSHPYTTEPIKPLSLWRVASPDMNHTQYSNPLVTPYDHFGLPAQWPGGGWDLRAANTQ